MSDSIQHIIDIQNGRQTASMQNIIYTTNPELFWKCCRSKDLMVQDQTSSYFIEAYDKKAKELGLPDWNQMEPITSNM